MWFRKRKEVSKDPAGAPPPWIDIDKIPKHKVEHARFSITDFVRSVTGFGNFGTKLLILGLALSLGFISYIIFQSSDQREPPPRDVMRPAIDGLASSTVRSAI